MSSPRSQGSSSSGHSPNPFYIYSPAHASSLGSDDVPEFASLGSYAEAFCITFGFVDVVDPDLIMDWYVKLEACLNVFPATRYDDRTFVEWVWAVLRKVGTGDVPWRYMQLYALKSREWDLDLCMKEIQRAKKTLAYRQKNLRVLTSDRANVDRVLENYLKALVTAAVDGLAAARRMGDEAHAELQEVKRTLRLPGWPANALMHVPNYAVPPPPAPVPQLPQPPQPAQLPPLPQTPRRSGRADNDMDVDRTPTSARRAARLPTNLLDTPRSRRSPRKESREPRLIDFPDAQADTLAQHNGRALVIVLRRRTKEEWQDVFKVVERARAYLESHAYVAQDVDELETLAKQAECYHPERNTTTWPREARAAIEGMAANVPIEVNDDEYASDDAAEVENDDPQRVQWESEYEASRSSRSSRSSRRPTSVSPHTRGGMPSPHSQHSHRSHPSPHEGAAVPAIRYPSSPPGRARSSTTSTGGVLATHLSAGGQSPQYTLRSPVMIGQPQYAALSPLQMPQSAVYGPPSPLNMPPAGYPWPSQRQLSAGPSQRQPSAGPSQRQPSAGPSQRQPSAGPSRQESRGGQDRMEDLRAREQTLSAQIHELTRRLHHTDPASGAYRQLWAEREQLNERIANLNAEIDALEEDQRRNANAQRSPAVVPFINLREMVKKRKQSGRK
ncbi:hypothetical protein C8Q70DRAFT_1058944 [Cubamyces menziesii]|nr:hypothetical protein C8Q70DRAFT_1058944 [Cubamyces menziesii]